MSIILFNAAGIKLATTQLMLKNGDQGPISSNTWTPITSWVAGNGDTLIAGDGLTAAVEAGAYAITESSEWPVAGDNKNWRILVNGVVVWTQGPLQTTVYQNTFMWTLNVGDVVTVEAWTSSGTSSRRIIKGGANTFLQLVPPSIWKQPDAVGAARLADSAFTSTTPVKTAGWYPDPARPLSQIPNDGILMPKSGNVWMGFNMNYKWGWTTTVNIAAYVNGVQRGATFTWTNTNSSTDVNWYGYLPITVTEGEVVDIYAWTGTGFAITVRLNSFVWVTPALATTGMVKTPVIQTLAASASPLQITAWQYEPGSTVTSDALVVPTTKSYTLNAAVNITATNFQTSHTMEIRKNGVLIPGATVTVNTTSLAAVILTIPQVTVSLAAGDVLTMWVSRVTGSTGSTIGADQQTFIRLS